MCRQIFLSLYSGYEVKPATGRKWMWFIKEMIKKDVFLDTMKAHGGVEIPLQSFLTLVLDGHEWSALLHGRSTPPPIERGVGRPVGQGALENRKFSWYYRELNQNSFAAQPVAWLLYRLKYPGSWVWYIALLLLHSLVLIHVAYFQFLNLSEAFCVHTCHQV